MAPSVLFGDISDVEVEDLRPVLLRYGIKRLDTAAFYGAGESERRMGDGNMNKEFIIDTKIMSGPLDAGALSPEKVDESSRQSLERLRTQQVNVLYCHLPDYKTPLEEQAKAFDDVHQKGRFKELGLSNFMPDMVESWVRISETIGYLKPTWYQGQYNLLCRIFEETLFPLLRQEGMHFAAYSPLGGGFLNGNFTPQNTTGTRFVRPSVAKSIYTGFYDRPEFHSAFEKLRSVAEETGLGTDELSLRWLMHHSQLQDDDVIILGASKIRHIEDTMQKLQKGPLDSGVVHALNELWTRDLEAGALEIVDPAKWVSWT